MTTLGESDLENMKQLLSQVVECGEPNYTTHPMSIWNRSRRMLAFLETGERISEALSWSRNENRWIL